MNAPVDIAMEAVRKAGILLRQHAGKVKKVNETARHDIKIELDVECQDLLSRHLLGHRPEDSILGEEGEHGHPGSDHRWIIDPIDGTVNFFYGIPHYSITVAFQRRSGSAPGTFETVAAVTYDPARDEMFSAEKGKGALLNGHPIRVSPRSKIGEAIMAIGFSKTAESAALGMTHFQEYTSRARKLRVMGSAALDLAYVAAGRLDAYYELVRLWDIAAGLLLVTEAGGRVATHPIPGEPHLFATLAFNGALPLSMDRGRLKETV